MSKNKINVLIVDDHALYRKGSVMMVRSFGIADRVLDAPDGRQALDILKQTPADLVLLDLEMPVMDGRETARQLLKRYPAIHIIMVSMQQDLEIISELIEIGVHSYILKDSEPEELLRAIQYVQNNEFYYNQIVSRALHRKVRDQSDHQHLTRREVEILQLICEELTMKEIGAKLFLSEQTVHTHRKNLMKKLNVNNAVGLVKYAIREKIVSI